MLDLLRHRGPDDRGVLLDRRGGVAIGATRLSIIDVEGGHQPLANEDGTVHAVLNGEIYNFKALRASLEAQAHRFRTRTDTEVLVHLYEEYGPDLVHALDGMYAFALWDERQQILLLGRDRLGEKPLFVRAAGGDLAFASELSALRAGLTGPEPELDPVAVDLLFSLGYVPGPGTIFSGIDTLPPATVGVWQKRHGLRLSTYWTPPVHPDMPAGEEAGLVEEAVAAMTRAVESRLVSDVPLGVFLSGGVDSTLVTALAARSTRPLKTFSVDYDVGNVSESEPARAVAAAIGTEHHPYTLTLGEVQTLAPQLLSRLDQPIADPAFVALGALSAHAREHVTVALGGEGADEVFGGYPRYRFIGSAPINGPATALARRLDRVATRSERLRKLVGAVVADSTARAHVEWVAGSRMAARGDVYGPRLAHLAGSRPDAQLRARVTEGVEDRAGYLMRLDAGVWLPDDVLAKADRASMLSSLELRAPFLARELVELAASVPASAHLQSGGKHLVRAALERVMPLPASRRRKVAFRVPLADWLRRALSPSFDEQLEGSWLYREGWFDRRRVRLRLKEHVEGRADHAHLLWPLFVIGCWNDGRA
jgi:asparagine synthase (glutamine-hydrolysing)